MTPGTSCGSIAKLAGQAVGDADAADRLAARPRCRRDVDPAPARRTMSSIAVRVGFRPTPSISISAPGVPAASAIQNVALETSPGTTSSRALSAARRRR